MERIYVGMGSNLADPAEQLRSAIDGLAQLPQTELVGVSAFYQSDSLPPGGFSRSANAAKSIERRGAWRLVRLADVPPQADRGNGAEET